MKGSEMRRVLFTSILLVMAMLPACSSVPDKVQDSMRGDLRDWRMVKKELVQPMPEGKEREVWLKRMAAFIVRARANVAWAEGAEEFDTEKAFGEEVNRVEE